MKKIEKEMSAEKDSAEQNPLGNKINRVELFKFVFFALMAIAIFASAMERGPGIKTEIVSAMTSQAESFGLDDVSVVVTGTEKINADYYYLVIIDSSNFSDRMPEQMIAIAERLSMANYYTKNSFTSKGDSYWLHPASGRIYKNGEKIYVDGEILGFQQSSSSTTNNDRGLTFAEKSVISFFESNAPSSYLYYSFDSDENSVWFYFEGPILDVYSDLDDNCMQVKERFRAADSDAIVYMAYCNFNGIILYCSENGRGGIL